MLKRNIQNTKQAKDITVPYKIWFILVLIQGILKKVESKHKHVKNSSGRPSIGPSNA